MRGDGGCTGRWAEPGMWAQYDFGDGPQVGATATVLMSTPAEP